MFAFFCSLHPPPFPFFAHTPTNTPKNTTYLPNYQSACLSVGLSICQPVYLPTSPPTKTLSAELKNTIAFIRARYAGNGAWKPWMQDISKINHHIFRDVEYHVYFDICRRVDDGAAGEGQIFLVYVLGFRKRMLLLHRMLSCESD